MKKFGKWLEDWLPTVWGCLWIVFITALSIGLNVWAILWLLEMLGVM